MEPDEFEALMELCIGHRRKHGLICNDVHRIRCDNECKVKITCPMNSIIDNNMGRK